MKIGVRSKEEKNKSDQIIVSFMLCFMDLYSVIFLYNYVVLLHICIDRIKVTLCIF